MSSAVSQLYVPSISFYSVMMLISIQKVKAQSHSELKSASDTAHVTHNWLH